MNASDFIAKWKPVDLSERSAAQQHFLDLCELVGHPKPVEADKTGDQDVLKKMIGEFTAAAVSTPTN